MKIDKTYKTKDWRDLQKLGKYKGELLLLSKLLLLSLLMIFHMVSLYAQTPRKDSGVNGQVKYELAGRVISSIDGTPMQGVSIRVDDENLQIRTSRNGTFELLVTNRGGKVKFSYVGFETQEINYTIGVSLLVRMIPGENKIDEVEVVSTGYQKIPKERATGSFEFVDNKLFNRKVSTNFVSRLEDIVPGLSSIKVGYNNTGKNDLMNINIRGVSSLSGHNSPLIIVDGVPYESKLSDYGIGNFNNINPNDIENVTVLKDAAAASIWGSQSGNGVIVITTKRGRFNERSQVSFNSNLSIKAKPDLYYFPQMNSGDFIDLQHELFDKGRYNSNLNRWNSNLTPAILLMKNKKEGKITEAELNAALNELKKVDMRDDFLKHVYRNAINQQYNLQLQTGAKNINNLISVGYDKNLNELVTSSFNRMSIKTATQVRPVKNLMLDIGITYTESKAVESYEQMGYNRMAAADGNYPYMDLADDQGNPLPISLLRKNPGYLDTVANGRLLDWSFNPLKEMYESKETQKIKETFLNFSGTYDFKFGLKINGQYAYQRTINPSTIWRGLGSFYQRDIINYYANWNDEKVNWNLPVGDFLYVSHWDSYAHQGRLNGEYNLKWKKSQLNLLAGFDIRELGKDLTSSQYYGYDPETGAFQTVPYGVEVPVLNGKGGVNTIMDRNRIESYRNRFVSYYANGSYTYADRYILSGSFRKDASNLYGVKTNDRGQPFWSIGGAWVASREAFIKDGVFDLLKLRATYGYNGNTNNTVAAYPIMNVQSEAHYITGQNYAMMFSPPNPALRWEKVENLNLGLDFSLLVNRISGSVEYYRKKPQDLIAQAPIDPTTGFRALTINSANLDTKGWDISLNMVPLQLKNWGWTSSLIFSYSRTKVKKSYVDEDVPTDFISAPFNMLMTPLEGMDLYTQLSYKWAGLDPETGEPRAYLNGEISKDYVALVSTDLNNLENSGVLRPLYFGGFRNTFRFKSLELSGNISYQLGHVFRRTSFNNNGFINSGSGHADYRLRWQKPGDEVTTDVPAFTYPNNALASKVYQMSSALVENAGQIKLRDIQLSYTFPNSEKMKLKNLRLYAYIQNVGTIWRANKWGIDPEYGEAIPEPLMTSLGINFNL
nr:SusC/RagA family TonB-linked outer membrane protein [uncultured Sphingobacterium sp.]